MGIRNFRPADLVVISDPIIPSALNEAYEDMSPKKTILRTLSKQQNGDGTPSAIHPSTIPGFQQDPARYQETINVLLKDRLIEGSKGGDGRMAISLNTHRQKDVRRVLRPIWAHPAVLALLGLSAALAGLGFLV